MFFFFFFFFFFVFFVVFFPHDHTDIHPVAGGLSYKTSRPKCKDRSPENQNVKLLSVVKTLSYDDYKSKGFLQMPKGS